jgi:dihydropteridine reductase
MFFCIHSYFIFSFCFFLQIDKKNINKAMSKQVIIYGGRGALGDCLVRYFKSKNFTVTSIDLKQNEQADVNITLGDGDSLEKQAELITQELQSSLKGESVDAILNVAGGWAGGNAGDKDFLKNSDLMLKQSVYSSLISASLANKFLKENGLLTLAGAAAALDSTPGMIGYGAAKAATIHIGKSLAGPNSGMPTNSSVLTIAPITLDTPMNRKWMSKADTSTWTPLEYIADLFYKWINDPSSRPNGGSVVKLTTTNGNTELSYH